MVVVSSPGVVGHSYRSVAAPHEVALRIHRACPIVSYAVPVLWILRKGFKVENKQKQKRHLVLVIGA